MYTLEDLRDINKLNEFRGRYSSLLSGICWGCPNSIQKALSIVYPNKKHEKMSSKLSKYRRKSKKDLRGNETWSLIYLAKAIKGIPSTIIRPIDDTDEICEVLEKELPDVFKLHYEKVQKEEVSKEVKAKK